jgi:hypothetical protein
MKPIVPLVLALVVAGAVPAVAAAQHGGSTDGPAPPPAVHVPPGCKEIKPNRVTTDSAGATYYDFPIPDQAVPAKSGTTAYDTLEQVLPPPGFAPSTASDEQLDKYQYPRFTHATPEARQKYLTRPHTRDIGVVTCGSNQQAAAAGAPASAEAAVPKFNCTERDSNSEAGYTGCANGGLNSALVRYTAPTLAGCPEPPNNVCGNSTWAGLGGVNVGDQTPAEPFYQAGSTTLPPSADPTSSQFLFNEYFSHGNGSNSDQLLDLLAPVKPGDVVTSEISYVPNVKKNLFGQELGQFSFCAVDTSAVDRSYCGKVDLLDSEYDLILSNPLEATAEAQTESAAALSVLQRQLEKWGTNDITFSEFEAGTPTGTTYTFPTFPTVNDPNNTSQTHTGLYPVQMCGVRFTGSSRTPCPTEPNIPTNLATVPSNPPPNSGSFQVTWLNIGPPR